MDSVHVPSLMINRQTPPTLTAGALLSHMSVIGIHVGISASPCVVVNALQIEQYRNASRMSSVSQ